MLKTRLHYLLMIGSMIFLMIGCSQEAEDKVADAGQDLEAAWQAEKDAAVEEMKSAMDSASEDIDAVQNRARQLESEGEEVAAKAWNDVADTMESAQDAAARNLQALEESGADAWQSARDKAQASLDSLDESWDEGKAAITRSYRNSVDAASEDIDAMKARAQELEAAGAERASAAWQRTIERMESACDAAEENVAALEEATADTWHDVENAASDAVNEVGEIGSRAKAFAADTKDDFIAGARSLVKKSEAELARARERLDEAEGEAKEEWQAVVDNLENKYDSAKAEAQKVEESGADAWGDLRHGFMDAYHDLEDAVAEASKEFKDD